MSKLTSFEDQVLLPVLVELVNREVKRKLDDKTKENRVKKEFAKTSKQTTISKAKLKNFLQKPEGRMSILQPAIQVIRRLRIIGDTPRINTRQIEQQKQAVRKQLSDDPEVSLRGDKENRETALKNLFSFTIERANIPPPPPRGSRGRPKKERGESAEQEKKRVGRPKVEERGEAKAVLPVGRPALLAEAEPEPTAQPVEEVLTVPAAQEAEALRRSRAEPPPRVEAVVPVAERKQELQEIKGRDFSKDEIKDARNALMRESKLASPILSAVSRMLSGSLSVERIFEMKTLTRNRVRNIAAGLALVAQSVQDPQLKRRSMDLSRGLGAAIIARSSMPIFAKALQDYNEDGLIRAETIDKVKKGYKPPSPPPEETGDTSELKMEPLDTLTAARLAAQREAIQQEWIDFFDELQRQVEANPQAQEVAIQNLQGQDIRLPVPDFMAELQRQLQSGLPIAAVVAGLASIFPMIRQVATGIRDRRPEETLTQTEVKEPPLVEKPKDDEPSFFTSKTIQVEQQEASEKPPKPARPEYIIPATKVLDPYADEKDRKADFEIEAAFDFHLPFAMNGQILEQNPLMQQHQLEQAIRYAYGGISFGINDFDNPMQVGFPPSGNENSVPALDFNDEYQQKPVNPNNSLRMNVEYNSMTEVLSGDGNDKTLRESNLYGLQPT